MPNTLAPPPSELTPDLARWNPEAFKSLALGELASTAYGAQIWNFVADHGSIDPNQFELDTSTWLSASKGSGLIRLGTQPMDTATKDRIMFHPERFPYPKEIGYKLLHEVNHSFLYQIQNTPSGETLLRAATDVRRHSNGKKGLSALGSLAHYSGDKKIIEDAVELLTVFAWKPGYAKEFTSFLSDTTQITAREQVGLIGLEDGNALYDIVSHAVIDNLPRIK